MFNDFTPDILKKYFPILLFLICLVAVNIATLFHFLCFPTFDMWFIGLFFGMMVVGCNRAYEAVVNIPYGYTNNLTWRDQIANEQGWFKWNLTIILASITILNVVVLFYEVSDWFVNSTIIAEAILYPYIHFVQKYALKTHSEISQELLLNTKEQTTNS